MFAWLLWITLSGYLVAWTFGLFIMGPLVLYFVLSGRIEVRGYWRFIGNVFRGRLLILTNHPSLLAETFLLGALTLPWSLVLPWGFLWTMPDKRLLDSWNMWTWVRVALRCIVVERSDREAGARGALRAGDILARRGVIIGHPEMGRTFGAANRDRVPLRFHEREMQKIAHSGLALLARRAGARILPGWVHVPYARESVSLRECLKRMFSPAQSGHWPIIYSFGRLAYRTKDPFHLENENARLQDEIFRA
jgi:hypothetical protein